MATKEDDTPNKRIKKGNPMVASSKNNQITKKIDPKYDILREYYFMVLNSNILTKIRKEIIFEKCPNLIIKTRNTLDDKIDKYLSGTSANKRTNISQTILASTLGIPKSQYSKNIERFLKKFGLERTLKQPSVSSIIKFEKLRMLIHEYFRDKKNLD